MCLGNGTTTIDTLFNENLTIVSYNIVISIIGRIWGVKMILNSRRRHYIARVGTVLVIVALIAGMAGCGGPEGEGDSYYLTIASTEGGSVTSPRQRTSIHLASFTVDLVAEPDEHYHFVNWTGDVGTIADVHAASTTITMNGDYSITANFELDRGWYSLTVSSTLGGSVIKPGEGISVHPANTRVDLVAQPDANYQFLKWTGDVGTIADVNDANTTITMKDSYTITAHFEAVFMIAVGDVPHRGA